MPSNENQNQEDMLINENNIIKPEIGIEIDGIPLVEHKIPVAEGDDHGTLQHQVELLAGMGDELRHGIGGLQCHQQGLHDLVGIAEGQVLEVIFGVSVDDLAAALADHVPGFQLGALAGDDLGEVHLEFVGDLIDDADGHVLAVFFIGGVDLRADVQLRRQILD